MREGFERDDDYDDNEEAGDEGRYDDDERFRYHGEAAEGEDDDLDEEVDFGTTGQRRGSIQRR